MYDEYMYNEYSILTIILWACEGNTLLTIMTKTEQR